MALRVLLADESTTIKRVIQLSLQDYAVNIQNVTVGLDVLAVALKFKPDIIFIDVLLPKKNGYDVCAELKSHPEFSKTPVVLIWSGFVELDKDRYQASQASGHLEKPFEINTLRNIVKNLVPKTKTQDLSQYLVFPDQPKQEKVQKPSPSVNEELLSTAQVSSLDNQVSSSSWGMEAFASVEQFAEIQLPTPTPNAPDLTEESAVSMERDLDLLKDEPPAEADASWSHKRLEKFRIDVNEDEDDDLRVEFEAEPQGKNSITASQKNTTPSARNSESSVSAAQIEKIIREQTKETLEQLVLKVLPEIAEQVIQRELQRLIAERK
jgi:two-component system cell cycle response regulator